MCLQHTAWRFGPGMLRLSLLGDGRWGGGVVRHMVDGVCVLLGVAWELLVD